MRVMRFVAALGAAALILAAPVTGRADEPLAPSKAGKPHPLAGLVDFSTGSGMNGLSGDANSAYGAATVALTRSLDRDGWRLKLSGGYGQYAYEEAAYPKCANLAREVIAIGGPDFRAYCAPLDDGTLSADDRLRAKAVLGALGYELRGNAIVKAQTVTVEHYDAAIMPGYQATFGRLILKAYAGLGYEETRVTPTERGQGIAGEAWGAMAATEAWLTLSDRLWLSADGSVFTGTGRYSTSARLGFRALSWLAAGPEAATFGSNRDLDLTAASSGATTRTGGFMRFDIGGMETTVSGGIASDHAGGEEAYGSASVYLKF